MEKLPNKYELIVYFLIANFFIFILYLFANENTQIYHPQVYRSSNMNILGVLLLVIITFLFLKSNRSVD